MGPDPLFSSSSPSSAFRLDFRRNAGVWGDTTRGRLRWPWVLVVPACCPNPTFTWWCTFVAFAALLGVAIPQAIAAQAAGIAAQVPHNASGDDDDDPCAAFFSICDAPPWFLTLDAWVTLAFLVHFFGRWLLVIADCGSRLTSLRVASPPSTLARVVMATQALYQAPSIALLAMYASAEPEGLHDPRDLTLALLALRVVFAGIFVLFFNDVVFLEQAVWPVGMGTLHALLEVVRFSTGAGASEEGALAADGRMWALFCASCVAAQLVLSAIAQYRERLAGEPLFETYYAEVPAAFGLGLGLGPHPDASGAATAAVDAVA